MQTRARQKIIIITQQIITSQMKKVSHSEELEEQSKSLSVSNDEYSEESYSEDGSEDTSKVARSPINNRIVPPLLDQEKAESIMQLHVVQANFRFGNRTFTCPYEECSRGYASRQRLKLHIESMHLNTATKFHCTACNDGRGCGFFAFERSTVIAHMRTHTGDKPYACRICGR